MMYKKYIVENHLIKKIPGDENQDFQSRWGISTVRNLNCETPFKIAVLPPRFATV
jgi:hypothetical protein